MLTTGTTSVHSQQNKIQNPTFANIQIPPPFHRYLRSRPTIPIVYVPVLSERCGKNYVRFEIITAG
jgi:hypothetical protein